MDNPDVRFDTHTREGVDDGWANDDELPVLRTQVTEEVPRTVITQNRSPDLSFDQSINPYRGCGPGAFIATPGPATPIWGCRRGLILKRG